MATQDEWAALGFGCSALVGPRTRDEAVQLLQHALSQGITHFDVSRVYGTGDAERWLGAFLKRHRDEVTVATKFGIAPLSSGAPTSALKSVVRSAMRRSPAVVRLVRRNASRTVQRGRFSPEAAGESLAASLKALGVDHVEGLLLHDCDIDDWESEELQRFLSDRKEAGIVDSCGVASSLAVGLAALDSEYAPDVVQAEEDFSSLRASLNYRCGQRKIAHVSYGVIGRHLGQLVKALESRSPRGDVLSFLPPNTSRSEAAAEALLVAALERAPGGTVLFQSSRPERIARAAAIARGEVYDEQERSALTDLVSQAIGPSSSR